MKVEIKKEVVTREIEVKTYVANDGTRFDDVKLCEQHEKKLARSNLEKSIRKIEQCKAAEGYSPLDGGEYNENHDYRWYRPKTREEADCLCEYYKVEMGISYDDIRQWICVEAYDLENVDEGCWSSPIRYSLAQIERLLNKLGYNIVISEMQNNES